MNNINIKNKIYFQYKNKQGFALLFSVLISSLLLTIGLSIFGITLKELNISNSARRSVYAFYSADSGLEYAKYRDLVHGDYEVETEVYRIPDSSDTYKLVDESDSNGQNFYVNIIKTPVPDGIKTIITSFGYDSISGDRVERAITQTY